MKSVFRVLPVLLFISFSFHTVCAESDPAEPPPWTMFLPAIIGNGHDKIDCNGETGGTAFLDNCNTCVMGTTGNFPCIQDCNGDWGGTAIFDACGVCDGLALTCEYTFKRSSSGNIVTDNKTHLMWQDSPLSFQDEAGGIAHCNQFSLDGYSNWRLPTLSEIQDFFKRVDADPDFDLNFWGTFSGCTANVAIGGYVKTPYGAEKYGGNTGDTINFSGGAAARCVR